MARKPKKSTNQILETINRLGKALYMHGAGLAIIEDDCELRCLNGVADDFTGETFPLKDIQQMAAKLHSTAERIMGKAVEAGVYSQGELNAAKAKCTAGSTRSIAVALKKPTPSAKDLEMMENLITFVNKGEELYSLMAEEMNGDTPWVTREVDEEAETVTYVWNLPEAEEEAPEEEETEEQPEAEAEAEDAEEEEEEEKETPAASLTASTQQQFSIDEVLEAQGGDAEAVLAIIKKQHPELTLQPKRLKVEF